jgi:hypothetical protein
VYPEGLTYVHPYPGSGANSAQTTIIIRLDTAVFGASNVSASDLAAIKLTSRKNGAVAYDAQWLAAWHTISITPRVPLPWADSVVVDMSAFTPAGKKHPPQTAAWAFTVADSAHKPTTTAAQGPVPTSLKPVTYVPGGKFDTARYKLPYVSVNRPWADGMDDADGGDVIVTSCFIGRGGLTLPDSFRNKRMPDSFLLFIDGNGKILRAQHWPGRTVSVVSVDEQEGVYFHLSEGLAGEKAVIYRMDRHFQIADSFRVGHGYPTSGHEFKRLANGNVLVLGQPLVPMRIDAARYGYGPDKIIENTVIQELTPTGTVVWEWRSGDHLGWDEAVQDVAQLLKKGQVIAPFHLNALDVDTDGNIIASARSLDQIIKIERPSGRILWRMGGAYALHNDFDIEGDREHGTSHQHGVNLLPNNRLLVFDNGNLRKLHRDRQDTTTYIPYSRAVEYALDQPGCTAKLVAQFRPADDPYRFGINWGYAQRLHNGHTLVTWGGAIGQPSISEFAPDGKVVWEITLQNCFAYRSFKVPAGTFSLTAGRR